MKRVALTVCALLLGFGAVAPRAVDLDFVLANETGFDIIELYLSPSNEESWEEDVLGDRILPDAEEIVIDFSRSERECLWDLMAVDEDADRMIFAELDLCTAVHVTLFWRDGKPVAQIEE